MTTGTETDDRLLALLQDLDQVRVDLEDVRDLAELLLGDLERVLAEMGDGGRNGGHEVTPCIGCK